MSNFVNHENTKHRPGGAYGTVIAAIKDDGVCPFCPEHLLTYHKNPILFETEHWLATDNMYPYKNVQQQVLFIHKAHIQNYQELSAQAWAELQDMLAAALQMKGLRGGALLFRFGDTAITGASVTHLHANLVAGTGAQDAEPVVARVG